MHLSDIDKLRDPIWRISSLYSIRTRDGKVIPFRRRLQQQRVLEMIFMQGLKRIVILKARQLGFSTLLGVICTDQLCWTTGKQLSLIDRTQENARQKLRDIVALAYDSLHDELKARFIVSRSNAGEFGVRFHEYDQAQTSTLFAGTHARAEVPTHFFGLASGDMCNAKTCGDRKRFSLAPSRAPRTGPSSSRQPGGEAAGAIFGTS
jgi:hypothetical protein